MAIKYGHHFPKGNRMQAPSGDVAVCAYRRGGQVIAAGARQSPIAIPRRPPAMMPALPKLPNTPKRSGRPK